MEELSVRWQAVYREVEDVVMEWMEAHGEENENEKDEHDILDKAEKVLCCVGGVYERLLPAPSPCTIWTTNAKHLSAPNADDTGQSDPALEPIEIITDSAHDDALGSRIAALLMVDFGLRDLDLDVGSKTGSDEEVDNDDDEATREELVINVLRACGSELCAMEKLYTPKEKAEVMVRAHRILVDGLTKLPFTIRLKDPEPSPKPESQSETESSPMVQSPQEQDQGEDGSKTAVPTIILVERALEERKAETDKAEENSKAASFSLDTLFPLLILSVVATNPPRLISHLLFTQRFLFTHRFQTSGSSAAGEQAYCLVNLMAVAEFIGSLDLEGVVNARMARGTAVFTEDGPMPMPLPMNSLPITIGSRPSSRRTSMSSQHSGTAGGSAPTTPVLSSSFTLRNRMEQQASALSSSANKVLTGVSGVVDSSIGGFGGLFRNMNVNLSLPGSLPLPTGFGFGDPSTGGPVTPALGPAQAAAPWNAPYTQSANVNPRDLMERKESAFSIKSLKLPAMPSIPAMPAMPTMIPNLTRSMTPGPGGSREKEMVSVSRPGSVRSMRSRKSGAGSLFGGDSTEGEDDSEDASEDDDDDDNDEESVDEDDEDDDGGDSTYSQPIDGGDEEEEESDANDAGGPSAASDARSIKSFESMMSDGKKQAKAKSRASKKKEKPDQKKKKSTMALDTVAGAAGAARKSLSDRLARVSSGISASKKTQASSPPASRRSSLLVAGSSAVMPLPTTPQSSRPQSPSGRSLSPQSLQVPAISIPGLPPPNARFLTCTSAEDLRLGEVKDLLRDYQLLVQAVKAAGGFSSPAQLPLGDNPLGV
ncbi:hypothetical protein BT96DRAFT_922827 [Gymnopus androsaceus JB14]|uniref:VPS9 domain-containing protein n=1 Tax=Gymnopus androsaceus JB14 TaxID=1447944 RepID=A0A6A4HCI2_9AGAR|nr:hypothetical protein BT96DRAFT_922827 [Gymnopus androsaceus JB14]